MLLIGVNRSPYTRRVAITLEAYGVPYEQQALSGFGNRAEVRAKNPLGRIPALVLDNGEVLVDSGAIIDHLDEAHGRDRALTPAAGADRRAVLKVAALMMGACDKGLHAAYERNHHPPEKVHQPWIDDCMAQMTTRARGRRGDGRSGQALSAAGPSHPGGRHRLHRRAARPRPRRRYRNADAAPARAHQKARGGACLPLDRAHALETKLRHPERSRL